MPALPSLKEVLYGFTVTETGQISMLGAKTVEFYHTFSGARLLYIQNDDRELGFNLIYRTPQTNEKDLNHILEHLMLCSCPKYPSRDIFFDMDSKSYSTFMNGLTGSTCTCYPVCSRSQTQLKKLIDVFLCCMEEPDALKDRRFFMREGVRLELERPQGPLTIHGTVLNEDRAHLTDLEENADSFVAHTLYKGQTASNLLGRAHLHYPDITFEEVQEVFQRCYHYSNCLIVLYGDMDYLEMLEFLHKEHLSRFPRRDCGLIESFNEPVTAGFFTCHGESPAYSGSRTDSEALIDYAIDLSDCTWTELICWDFLAGMLDNDTSVFHQFIREAGINSSAEVYLDTASARPSLRFRLHNSSPQQKDAFCQAAVSALSHVGRYGIPGALFSAAMKETRISDGLTRETSDLGFHISDEIGKYWSITDKTDYFTLYENALYLLSEEGGGSILKKLAHAAAAPTAAALVVTVPRPGLAEELEEQKELWLKETLEGMTEEQALRLIQETQVFYDWSSRPLQCSDFMISPMELPEPEQPPDIIERRLYGLHCLGTAAAGEIGCFQIFFDLSGLSGDDLNCMALYQMLLTELDTEHYTVEQQKQLEQEYLHDCTFDELYPDERAGTHSHPMLGVLWYGLLDDFYFSLELLLELMGGSHYEDRETILQVVEKYLPDYDLSKMDTGSSLAYSLAECPLRKDSQYRYILNSPEIYPYLKEVRDTLRREQERPDDPELRRAAEDISISLRRVAGTICRCSDLVFMAAAAPDSLEQILENGARRLNELPHAVSSDVTDPLSAHSFPLRVAAAIDSPLQEIRMMGDFKMVSEFNGSCLPFLLAVSDRYIKPRVRFQGGAYDSGLDFSIPAQTFTLWSTSDPAVGATLQVFEHAGEALEELQLSKEELTGYILSAYALALPSDGMLNSRMRFLRRYMMGISSDAVAQMISDIKNSRPEDRTACAGLLKQLLRHGSAAVVGNKKAIDMERHLFDKILRL